MTVMSNILSVEAMCKTKRYARKHVYNQVKES